MNLKRPFGHYIISSFVLIAFFCNITVYSYAQNSVTLPVPGTPVGLSAPFQPPLLNALKVYPQNPFRFDFIIDTGDSGVQGEALKEESQQLIKYFLAALTIPENDLWVNLSPYEKNRIIPDSFAQTEMGRDLLAQDYLLKQITATLMNPHDQLGQTFWDNIRAEVQSTLGVDDVNVEAFNKVWIVPAKAVVYENTTTAYVQEARLKVMLEDDYLANAVEKRQHVRPNNMSSELHASQTAQIVRDIILPALEREVNEGKHFVELRQIYHVLILANWYKRRLKKSIIGQLYVDQNKTHGIALQDTKEVKKIYQRYLDAFKQGAYDIIEEDYDPQSQAMVAHKYFSGGVAWGDASVLTEYYSGLPATASNPSFENTNNLVEVRFDSATLQRLDDEEIFQDFNDRLAYEEIMAKSKDDFPETEDFFKYLAVTYGGRSGRMRQGYHSFEHGLEVSYLTDVVLEAAGAGDRNRRVAHVATALHDLDIRDAYVPPKVNNTVKLIQSDVKMQGMIKDQGDNINEIIALIRRTEYPYDAKAQKLFDDALGEVSSERRNEIRYMAEIIQFIDKSSAFLYLNPNDSFKRKRELIKEIGVKEGSDEEMAADSLVFRENLKSDPIFDEAWGLLPEWAKNNWRDSDSALKKITKFDEDSAVLSSNNQKLEEPTYRTELRTRTMNVEEEFAWMLVEAVQQGVIANELDWKSIDEQKQALADRWLDKPGIINESLFKRSFKLLKKAGMLQPLYKDNKFEGQWQVSQNVLDEKEIAVFERLHATKQEIARKSLIYREPVNAEVEFAHILWQAEQDGLDVSTDVKAQSLAAKLEQYWDDEPGTITKGLYRRSRLLLRHVVGGSTESGDALRENLKKEYQQNRKKSLNEIKNFRVSNEVQQVMEDLQGGKRVPYGFWNEEENARQAIVWVLDQTPEFKAARKRGSIEEMAQAYRDHIQTYDAQEQSSINGAQSYFYYFGKLQSLMTRKRPFLDARNSPMALLRFAFSALVDEDAEGALRPWEILESWDDQRLAKKAIIQALDVTIPFKEARIQSDAKRMVQAYRDHIQTYDAQGKHAVNSALTYFIVVGKLRGVMSAKKSFLDQRSSPIALLRFALPGLVDEDVDGLLRPWGIEDVWNNQRLAKKAIIQTLDKISDFKEARKQGNVSKMARVYRDDIKTYDSNGEFFKNGAIGYFLNEGQLAGLMSNTRSFLDKTNSPAALLAFAIPELVDQNNPDALQSNEIEYKIKTPTDASTLPDQVGGIDLTADRFDLDVRNEKQEDLFTVDPEQLQNMNIKGLVPVIIDIKPITNLPLFLSGQQQITPVKQMSKVYNYSVN